MSTIRPIPGTIHSKGFGPSLTDQQTIIEMVGSGNVSFTGVPLEDYHSDNVDGFKKGTYKHAQRVKLSRISWDARPCSGFVIMYGNIMVKTL